MNSWFPPCHLVKYLRRSEKAKVAWEIAKQYQFKVGLAGWELT
jgi:hypothetical protein